MEQAATSVHMATQFTVMKTRHNRATGDEESDRRKEAHQEEERNQAQRDLVERRRKAANCVCSAVMRLIDAKRAQSEDGKVGSDHGRQHSRHIRSRPSTRMSSSSALGRQA